MEIIYLQQALDDLEFWKQSGNSAIHKKITSLIESMEQTPFEGLGKPEQLKYSHAGKWSRRINKEHRIIYEMEEGKLFISSIRGHYK